MCAINVFGSHWHLAVLDQIPSCPFVCAPSSSFMFTLASIGFLRKCIIVHLAVFGQIPLHRARLSALGQILSCSRAMMRRFVKYWIPQLKDERKVTCFSDLEHLQKKRTKLIHSAQNLRRTKCFNS